MKSLNKMAKEIHQNAVDHGFYEGGTRSFGEIVALCHSELSEALEEHRSGQPLEYVSAGKPEGIAVEMADCIIRILDWAGFVGADIDGAIERKCAYNRTRPYRHGGKRM